MQFLVFEGIIGYVLYVIQLFMEKLFTQFRMWILRYRKRLIYWVLALIISQICFFNFWWLRGANQVFAEEPESPIQNATFQQKATNWLQDLSFYRRVFYVLLYPILALAGMLVNNSLIYAEAFNFDTVLWQLWNIVRNLSNYALWFLFIFKIFKYLVDGQKSDDMKKLLKSTLIAWVWIQASWFLLAVLIDVSNIITYSVWGLPIRTLWQQNDFWNPSVFTTTIYTDTNTPDAMHFYLSNDWNTFISECRTFSYWFDEGYEELILAPKMIYYYDTDTNSYQSTQKLACHVWDDVYYFKNLFNEDGDIKWPGGAWAWWKEEQENYRASLENAIKKLDKKQSGEIDGLIQAWTILEIWDAHAGTTDRKITYSSGNHVWLDVNNEWNGWWLWLKRLKDVLSWSYVWVFTALYSSLLNAWEDLRVSKISDPGIYTSLLNVVLSLCHTLAVWIPLIAMLVVFIMRIWIIWMAIVLSPAIILLKAFDLEEKIWKDVDILKYLSVKNLIGIIFSPAIICFAVSISTVLVRIISDVNMQGVITDDVDILWWLIKLNIGWVWLNLWKLLCSAIWVAISWFLIWSAVKASKLWESNIIKSLESFAKTSLWSAPIIPIVGKDNKVDYVWVNSVFGWNGQRGILSKFTDKLKTEYRKESDEAVNALFDPKSAEKQALKNRASAYTTRLLWFGATEISPDWYEKNISIWENEKKMEVKFSDFGEEEQKTIINKINSIEDSDVRKAFGKAWTLKVWNTNYTFNEDNNIFESGKSSSSS